MSFQTFSKEQFEGCLGINNPFLHGNEYVYDLLIGDNRIVRVYSSINASGKSRGAGRDAIRVFIYDTRDERPLTKSRRIYRTEGALQRLKDFIEDLKTEYGGIMHSTQKQGLPTVIEVPVKQDEWTSTGGFSLMEFGYERFNPVQSAFLKVYSKEGNAVIAAATSAGKTAIAEMAFAQGLSEGKACIYLCPLKALAQEKIDDWSDPGHPFSTRKLAIATGDYLLPENREKTLKECSEADITVMTSELLDSLTRRIDRVMDWFKKVGVIVIDEGHLLSMPQRGSALECALMRYSAVAGSRILFLSATMPNTKEIAEWLCALNNKNTYLISSDWRPCKLDVWYEPYRDSGTYYEKMGSLKLKVIDILQRYPSDKFIVFTHTKAIGRQLLENLENMGIKGEFHNADKEKAERARLAEEFKDGGLNVLLATSTLAYGLNLPARRVIIAGVHRGLQEVSVLDLKQMVGRSGRVGLDPRGDAYILYPESKEHLYKDLLDYLPDIESRLADKEELAFHLVNEINEDVNTLQRLLRWYQRSFAAKRGHTIEELKEVIDELIYWGAIKEDTEGRYVTTPVGKIASWFYYSPYMVARLRSGFLEIPQDSSDYDISWAIGNAFPGYPISNSLRDKINNYVGILQGNGREVLYDRVVNCYAIYLILSGMSGCAPEIASIVRGFQADSGRVSQTLKALSRFYKDIKQDFDILSIRLKYGVASELAQLCTLPGIGAVRAQRLYGAGLKTIGDISADPGKASKLIGTKLVGTILNNRQEATYARVQDRQL